MSITDQIQKATNERLTSEDWQALIAVCDSMNEAGPADQTKGFQALYKRLESPVGNAQMYGLTLLNALAQSGGPRVKSAIASQETRRVLKSVLSGPHRAVRDRAKDIIKDLDEALQDAEFSKWSEQQSGETPEGTSGSSQDDEEEQIRQAIRLSMQDQPAPRAHGAAAGAISNGAAAASRTSIQSTSTHTTRAETPTDSNSEILASVHKSPKPAAAPVQKVKTLYAYSSTTNGDLNFRAGEIIQVVDSSHKDWWKGSLNGVVGVFPSNYVELVSDQPIATEEDYIFAQAPNVERLLSIFASASQQPGYSIVGNPDLQAMYDEVMALRPQLIRMIDEYGARKQKLMRLNGDIGEARQRYEQLVNARMVAQPAGAFQFENYEPERGRAEGTGTSAAAGAGPSAPEPQANSLHAPYAQTPTQTHTHATPSHAAVQAAHANLSPSAPIYPDYPTHLASAPSHPLASAPPVPVAAPTAPLGSPQSPGQGSSKLPYPI